MVIAYQYVTSYGRQGTPSRWRDQGCAGCDWRLLQSGCGAVCSAPKAHVWSIYAAQWSTRSAEARPHLPPRGGRPKELIVRRLSIASPDSGAESPVYGEEPSAAADRAPVAKPPWAGGERPADGARRASLRVQWRASSVGPACLTPRAARGRASHRADTRHHGDRGLTIPGQVGTGAPSLATTCDMSVVDQQGARWYVRDIRASTQPMGTP